MTTCQIRLADGTLLAVGPELEATVSKEPSWATAFDREDRDGGFAFRSRNGKVLAVRANGMLCFGDDEASSTFAFADDGSLAQSIVPLGGVLCLMPGGLGPAKVETLPPPSLNEAWPGSCSGHVRPHLRFEIETHQNFFAVALAILSHHRAVNPDAAFVVDFFGHEPEPGSKPLVKEALRGLEWADTQPPYDSCLYGRHFYNPETGNNFWKDTVDIYFWTGNSWRNALTECMAWFWSSAARIERLRENYRVSGSIARGDGPQDRQRGLDIGVKSSGAFELGLSLHYLTDLCQPMHAANFINRAYPWDFRHSGFEEAAEALRKDEVERRAKGVPTAYKYVQAPDSVSLAELALPDQLYELVHTQAACKSKKRFDEELKPILDRMHAHRAVYDTHFGPEIEPILQQVLPFTDVMAARLLLYWASTSPRKELEQLYRHMLERPVDDSGLATWGEVMTTGRPLSGIVRGIALSEEYKNRTLRAKTPQETVRTLYRHLLAREVESDAALNSWVGWMSEEKWTQAIDYFLASPEYQSLFGPYRFPRKKADPAGT